MLLRSYAQMTVACKLLRYNIGHDFCPPVTISAAAPTQEQLWSQFVQSYATISVTTTALLQQWWLQLLHNNGYGHGLYTLLPQRRPWLLSSCNNVGRDSYATMATTPTQQCLLWLIHMTVVRNNCGSLYSDDSHMQQRWFIQQWQKLIHINGQNLYITMATIHTNGSACTWWLCRSMYTQQRWWLIWWLWYAVKIAAAAINISNV